MDIMNRTQRGGAIRSSRIRNRHATPYARKKKKTVYGASSSHQQHQVAEKQPEEAHSVIGRVFSYIPIVGRLFSSADEEKENQPRHAPELVQESHEEEEEKEETMEIAVQSENMVEEKLGEVEESEEHEDEEEEDLEPVFFRGRELTLKNTKLKQLKQDLHSVGLSMSGNKRALLQRLREFVEKGPENHPKARSRSSTESESKELTPILVKRVLPNAVSQKNSTHVYKKISPRPFSGFDVPSVTGPANSLPTPKQLSIDSTTSTGMLSGDLESVLHNKKEITQEEYEAYSNQLRTLVRKQDQQENLVKTVKKSLEFADKKPHFSFSKRDRSDGTSDSKRICHQQKEYNNFHYSTLTKQDNSYIPGSISSERNEKRKMEKNSSSFQVIDSSVSKRMRISHHHNSNNNSRRSQMLARRPQPSQYLSSSSSSSNKNMSRYATRRNNRNSSSSSNSSAIAQRILATLGEMSTPLEKITAKPVPSSSLSWARYQSSNSLNLDLDFATGGNNEVKNSSAPPPVASIPNLPSQSVKVSTNTQKRTSSDIPVVFSNSSEEIVQSIPPVISNTPFQVKKGNNTKVDSNESDHSLNISMFSSRNSVESRIEKSDKMYYQFTHAKKRVGGRKDHCAVDEGLHYVFSPPPKIRHPPIMNTNDISNGSKDETVTDSKGAFKFMPSLPSKKDVKVPTPQLKAKTPPPQAAPLPATGNGVNPLARFCQVSSNSWKCPACLVRNDGKLEKCPCCETNRPSSFSSSVQEKEEVPPKSSAGVAITGSSFSFGSAPTQTSSDSACSTGFSFPSSIDKEQKVGDDKTIELSSNVKFGKPSSTTFSFGVAKNDDISKESSTKGSSDISGFSFSTTKNGSKATSIATDVSFGKAEGKPATKDDKDSGGINLLKPSVATTAAATPTPNGSPTVTSTETSNIAPKFNFGQPTVETKGEPLKQVNTFSFGGSKEETNIKPSSADPVGFTFGAPASTEAHVNKVAEAPPAETKKASFEFGISKNVEEKKSSTGGSSSFSTFTFGSTTSSSAPSTSKTTGAFTFGSSNNNGSETDKTTPSFSFGAADTNAVVSTSSTTKYSGAPSFSFGSSNSNSSTAPPPSTTHAVVSTTSATTKSSAAPSFSFGSSNSNSSNAPPPSFSTNPTTSFSEKPTPSSSTVNSTSSTFTFGTSGNTSSNKPPTGAPSFGSTTSAAAGTAPTFGVNMSATGTAPAFGAKAPSTAAAPSFGSSAASAPAPSFTFGAPSSSPSPFASKSSIPAVSVPTGTANTAPSFSFGGNTPAAAAGASSTGAGFTFGATPSTSSTSSNPFGNNNASSNPFGSSSNSNNPFGATASGMSSSNPFGNNNNNATMNDASNFGSSFTPTVQNTAFGVSGGVPVQQPPAPSFGVAPSGFGNPMAPPPSGGGFSVGAAPQGNKQRRRIVKARKPGARRK